MSLVSRIVLAMAGAGALAALATGVGAAQDVAQDAAAPKPRQGPPPMPAPITLASRPNAGPGEKLFIEKCAMCHGPNGMGTGLLARRTDVALLEARQDLPTDYVVQAARTGIGNMPAIPRGEVSDAQMQEIATYLSRNTPAADGGSAGAHP
ncbi:c-type cytochrome [Novosphingobium profundi]|uniref:c-type cytochrome n=1 Tax=Novosphingobium profundi TaxID=1774954 RepID=UPI001FE6F627|nr:cytochrome c [Novosphingobium profundi]